MFGIFKKKIKDHFLGVIPNNVCDGYCRAEHITLVKAEENKVFIYLKNGTKWTLEHDDHETAIKVSKWFREKTNEILNGG